MKRILVLFVIIALAAGGCATSTSQYPTQRRPEPYGRNDRYDRPDYRENRLEQRLERYARELNLSRSQIRDLRRIQERYDRRNTRNDRYDYRRIEEQKNREMLSVLTRSQRDRLNQLEQRDRRYYDRRS